MRCRRVGSSAEYPGIAHHNIHFGRSWEGVFTDLIDRGQLMADPSLFLTNPTRSDPSLAPDGKESRRPEEFRKVDGRWYAHLKLQ